MKVIFLTAVPPYRAGQVAEVSAGYAQNFLIPKALAKPATPAAMDQAKHAAAAREHQHTLDAAKTNALAQALQGAHVRLQAPQAPSGTLYAAVTPKQLQKAIVDAVHHEVPLSLLEALPPIKQAGEHQLSLPLPSHPVTFTLHV